MALAPGRPPAPSGKPIQRRWPRVLVADEEHVDLVVAGHAGTRGGPRGPRRHGASRATMSSAVRCWQRSSFAVGDARTDQRRGLACWGAGRPGTPSSATAISGSVATAAGTDGARLGFHRCFAPAPSRPWPTRPAGRRARAGSPRCAASEMAPTGLPAAANLSATLPLRAASITPWRSRMAGQGRRARRCRSRRRAPTTGHDTPICRSGGWSRRWRASTWSAAGWKASPA